MVSTIQVLLLIAPSLSLINLHKCSLLVSELLLCATCAVGCRVQIVRCTSASWSESGRLGPRAASCFYISSAAGEGCSAYLSAAHICQVTTGSAKIVILKWGSTLFAPTVASPGFLLDLTVENMDGHAHLRRVEKAQFKCWWLSCDHNRLVISFQNMLSFK